MRPDTTTLRDLSIFGQPEGDVLHLLDHCTTQAGRDRLKQIIKQPPADYEALLAAQATTTWWLNHPDDWTDKITNGTLVMLDKFYESADAVAAPATGAALVLGSMIQRLFNRGQYAFIQFSLAHVADFLAGCAALVSHIRDEGAQPPERLARAAAEMHDELQHPLAPLLAGITKSTPYPQLARLSYRARRELKSVVARLLDAYARLDAWRSLATATTRNGWVLPRLLPQAPMLLQVSGLYHPLLATPVPYDVSFAEGRNFLLLTGANMSGKTTFMRALGVGALLAHLGCGVPAAQATFSFLQGIITNMHVEDNILRGESYFFAEVQRMKQTAARLNEDAPFLVLMDELFKGTNVYDAYECTRAVVEGLLHNPQHLMILSTHLHEVAHLFAASPEVQLACFVTTLGTGEDKSYRFTYQLRPGISDDRIGFRILQQEGVIELLNRSALSRRPAEPLNRGAVD